MLDANLSSLLKLRPCYVVHGIPEVNYYWLFNLESGEHYELNESAYWVVEKLNGKGVVWKDLIELFINEYQVDIKEAREDLIELLDVLRKEGILEKTSL